MEPFAGTITWPNPWRAFTTGVEILRNRPAIACSRCRPIQPSSIAVPESETEPGKSVTDFRHRHEEPPQQSAAIIFDHQDDRGLVYGEKCVGEPAARGIEGIGEAITAPDFIAIGGEKM